MKHFQSIKKLDTSNLYVLELTSSLSWLLLAFGLIVMLANVLTKGSVLMDSIIMQRIWALKQCVDIDASVAGIIIRNFRSHAEGERLKIWLYGFLSALLLFTAAIVSNIERVQQTLSIALERPYLHVFVPLEALIWIRFLAVVLQIVAHAMRHVHREHAEIETPVSQPLSSSLSLMMTPNLVETIRALLAQTTVSAGEANSPQSLPSPRGEQGTKTAQEAMAGNEDEYEVNNYEWGKASLATHPEAKVKAVAAALTINTSTANKWMTHVKGKRSDV